MTIEIDEKDFKEIQDRMGDIRETAIVVPIVTEKDCVERLVSIACTAREITALLNKGNLTPEAETTKFIERYSYWICEKCGHKWPASEVPEEWDLGAGDAFISCDGCGLQITVLVPLVREGG